MEDGPHDLTMRLPAKRRPAFDEKTKKYVCGFKKCSHSSKRCNNVTRHEKTMHRPKTIECCGKKFPTKFDFIEHKKLMDHDKNGFSCDLCGRNCKLWPQLARHKLTHSGEKKFKCGIGKCKHASHSKSNLLRHQKSSKHQKKEKARCNAADDLTHPQDRVSDMLTPTPASRSPLLSSTPNELQTNEIRLSPDRSSPLLDSLPKSMRSIKPKRKRSINAIQPPTSGFTSMKPISEPKSNILRHQRSSKHQKNDSFSTREKNTRCNAADDLTHPQDRMSDILTPTPASRLPLLFSTPNELQANEIRLSPDRSSPLLDSLPKSMRSIKPNRKRSINAIQPPNSGVTSMQPISEPKSPYQRLARFDPPSPFFRPWIF